MSLARGPKAIDRENKRLGPLVRHGAYIPTMDHRFPPDVTPANYL